ncbi:alginate lyase family protein [Sphingomonas gilva]|uniref:alginate lyase family protein n=1 Tax=Sphingomonas gilva TaxID=2305907 RepID=UPI001FE41C35|nr:alginate lyase family protein [Sphingomonas gilva]
MLRALAARTDGAALKAKAALVARADAALMRGPYTVADKRTVPPSGNRRDYLSVGPYWWPDPAKKDGLPYIRRDGEVNPDRASDKYDRADLGALSADVEMLGLAYYFTGDAAYARHAADLLDIWFLHPRLGMRPNMNFAQAVPGRENGRAEGIIDTAGLQGVVEAIGLIAPSGALTAERQAGLERWFSAYVDWLMTSRNGRAEDAAKNNHGLWYDSQLVHFALFARRPEVARKVAEAFPRRRVAPQIASDGRMPHELARTRSLHYSVYALTAAYNVADLGRCVGVDLWNGAEGLRRATDFIVSYRGRIDRWPDKEIDPEPDVIEDLVIRANRGWPGAGYEPDDAALLRAYFKSDAR